MSKFNLKLHKKRPLWKDLIIFIGLVFILWGCIHFFLNYSAFSQIIEYKINTTKASLIQEINKVQREVTHTINNKVIPRPESKLSKIKTIQTDNLSINYIRPKNKLREVFLQMPVYPSDNRLYIPRIGKNVPLVQVPGHTNWQKLEKFIQKGLQDGVVIHPISHSPDTYGNFFLTGHSSYYKWDNGRFKDVFALLHEVKEGDSLEVYWEGKKYDYIIGEKKIVPPTEVSVLHQPKNRSIITLMTCTPVGTNKNRLILVADLVNKKAN